MPKSETHSHRDYTVVDLRNTKPEDWSGQTIVGTQFGREKPKGHPKGKPVKVSPEAAHSIVFVRCCLDNAEVPPGSSLVESTTRNFEVQSDGRDWIVDRDGKPLVLLEEVR